MPKTELSPPWEGLGAQWGLHSDSLSMFSGCFLEALSFVSCDSIFECFLRRFRKHFLAPASFICFLLLEQSLRDEEEYEGRFIRRQIYGFKRFSHSVAGGSMQNASPEIDSFLSCCGHCLGGFFRLILS